MIDEKNRYIKRLSQIDRKSWYKIMQQYWTKMLKKHKVKS